jgi:hypothetical protein
MMPGIKIVWVLTCIALQIVDRPLPLSMKIMVLTRTKRRWRNQRNMTSCTCVDYGRLDFVTLEWIVQKNW